VAQSVLQQDQHLASGSPAGRPFRLAILTSHPIQYQAPLFRAIAACPDISLHVFFCFAHGAREYADPGFGVTFSWDVPLLVGYEHSFLRNYGIPPGRRGYKYILNPGIALPLLRRSFDALWINGWANLTNWLAWVISGLTGMPLLLRTESDGIEERTGAFGGIRRSLLTMMFSRVACFLAIGSNNRNFYRSHGVPENRIFWTPYAVDNEFFISQAQRLRDQRSLLRQKDGIAVDRPLVLFCGKLVPKKRPMDLLQAFCSLASQVPASLGFAGDGPLRQEMQEFVEANRLSNVHFLGFRNQTELPACYAMSDVLVLPSAKETWGLVVNEAMCFGLPVIASDRVGAAADLVQSGRNGFRYSARDIAALTRALSCLLTNNAKRIRMGRESFEIISKWNLSEDVVGLVAATNRLRSNDWQITHKDRENS
jgi:glycosyltransferase involved in cell wall biosynthesis